MTVETAVVVEKVIVMWIETVDAVVMVETTVSVQTTEIICDG